MEKIEYVVLIGTADETQEIKSYESEDYDLAQSHYKACAEAVAKHNTGRTIRLVKRVWTVTSSTPLAINQ